MANRRIRVGNQRRNLSTRRFASPSDVEKAWIAEPARETRRPNREGDELQRLLDYWTRTSETTFSELTKDLTPRQKQVLCEFLHYMDDPVIARRLRISEPTVRNQITAIEHTLGVNSRVRLAVVCWASLLREMST